MLKPEVERLSDVDVAFSRSSRSSSAACQVSDVVMELGVNLAQFLTYGGHKAHGASLHAPEVVLCSPWRCDHARRPILLKGRIGAFFRMGDPPPVGQEAS